MKTLFERQFCETMIRGTLGMLNDTRRMIDRKEALQFIFDQTGATTEDEIKPMMRSMTCDECMNVNRGMVDFLKPYFS
jgi:hypothetical protein